MARRKKFPQTPVCIKTHALSNDGRGVASVEGKATFITGALADETVEFRYTACKRHFDEGRLETVIEASPHRVAAECAHFDFCGGCSLQHLSHDEQLNTKQTLFIETLKRIGHCEPEKILPPLQATTQGYRTKARLSVRYVEKKSSVLVGFREKRSSYVVDMNSCSVLDERVGMQISTLRAWIETLSIKSDIPQIEVATDETTCYLIFRVMRQPSAEDIQLFKTFAQEKQYRILLQPAGPDSVCDLDGQPATEERLSYRIDDNHLVMQFHPQDFTQVNPAINRAMIEQAMSLLDPQPNEVILDLFCGLGNFSLPLARRAKTVIGVEGDEKMVQRAAVNSASNHLNNTEFYAADLFKEQSYQAEWAQQHYDKVLIDPPRSGALEAMHYVAKAQPSAVLYVSCDPATLARDAAVLTEKYGYKASVAGIMDMFPHTTHIESMILFTLSS